MNQWLYNEVESEYAMVMIDRLKDQIKELFFKKLLDKNDTPIIEYDGCILEYVPVVPRECFDSGVLVHFEDGPARDLNDLELHELKHVLNIIKG